MGTVEIAYKDSIGYYCDFSGFYSIFRDFWGFFFPEKLMGFFRVRRHQFKESFNGQKKKIKGLVGREKMINIIYFNLGKNDQK